MKNFFVAAIIAALLVAVIGGFLSMIYGPEPDYFTGSSDIDTEAGTGPDVVAFLPPDPEQAPPPLGSRVKEGYWLLMETGKFAPDKGSQASALSCRNCHFEAGRSRDGITLVGVAGKYPRVAVDDQGQTEVRTLAQQVQQCFRVNLGWQPPAEDSPSMQAILFYLQWISRGVPVYGEVEWLGLDPITIRSEPNPSRAVYANTCAKCHGPDGQGSIGPALWGDGSFTTGSQFVNLNLLASFVYQYMPFKNPDLEPVNAINVSAFLLTMPRPEPGAEKQPVQTAAQQQGQKAAGTKVPPARAGRMSAPPMLSEVTGKLKDIANKMQQQGGPRIPEITPPPKSVAEGAPEKLPGKYAIMTLKDKLQQLDRPLPALSPPKWTSGAVIHSARTKPGHTAGVPLMLPPPVNGVPTAPFKAPAKTPRVPPGQENQTGEQE